MLNEESLELDTTFFVTYFENQNMTHKLTLGHMRAFKDLG